jgi:hypothetical protein
MTKKDWKHKILKKWENIYDAPEDIIRELILDEAEEHFKKKVSQ